MLTLTAHEGQTKVNISDGALAMLRALELASGRKDHEILDAAIQAQRLALVPVAKEAAKVEARKAAAK